MRSRSIAPVLLVLSIATLVAPSIVTAQALPAPTNAAAVATSDTQIELTWADNATNESAYQVERSLTPNSGFVVVSKLRANKTYYKATRLTTATTYYFRVQATRKGYPGSAYSNTASAMTLGTDLQPPTTPTGLIALPTGCTTIALSWSPTTDTGVGMAGYQIYRDGSVAGSVVGTTFTDSGLAALSAHTYNVSAFDGNGNYSPMSVAKTASTTSCGTVLNQPPVAQAGPDQVSETLTTLTFNGSSSSDPDGTINAFSWNFGDGATATGPIVSHAFASSGAFTVTLTVTDGAGASGADTMAVTILNRAPIANAGLDLAGTAGQPVPLDGTNSRDLDGTIPTFSWNFGDGWGGSGATTSHIYSAPGTYTVTLSVTDDLGATGSDSTTVTVNPAATAPAAPSALAATAISSSRIDLTWSDNSTNETAFKIERSASSSGPWTQVGQTSAAAWSNSGLTAATTYFYRVRATNSTGDSAYSNTDSATTNDVAPAAPSALSATAVSSTQISLSWTDNASNETGFKIERAASTSGPWTQVGVTTSGSWSDSGLLAATSYSYRVRAYNTVGDSAYSNTDSATTGDVAPAAPSALSATAVSSSQIALSWTDNSGNETGFKIERAASTSGPWTQVGVTTSGSWSDSGLLAATSYSYRVRAYNAAGDSSYSNTASATTGAVAPTAPSGLVATAVSTTQISLNWSDNSGNEAGFKVERAATVSGPWSQIGVTTATTWNDSGLPTSTSYSYRVRAYNSAGDSAYSNTASATTGVAAPAAPGPLTATLSTPYQIELAWSDNSGNEAGFKLERATSTSGPWTQIGVTTSTAWSDGSLASGTTFYYRVKAYNTGGDSAYSNTAFATTGLAAPAAPSGLTASAPTSNQISLAWTDNSSNEAGFKIERASVSSGPWTQIGVTTGTAWSDSGLAASSTFYYRVKAYNSGGDSAYTNTATATTAAVLPGTPTGLSANALSDTQVSLSWVDNSTNETGFKVERGPSASGAFTQIAVTGAGVAVYVDSGLTASTTYYYRVRAYNSVGDSFYTNAVSATTVTASTGGAQLWSKRFGDTFALTEPAAVSADATGNSAAVGTFFGSMDFGGGVNISSGGGYDGFVVRYSSTGAPVWAKRLGGSLSDYTYGVAIDSNGSVIVSGEFQGTVDFGCGPMVNPSGNSFNMFIAKLSGPSGLCQWSKNFGSTYKDTANAVAVDSLNNVYVTGHFWGTVDFGGTTLTSHSSLNYDPDAFVMKLDASGQTIWAKGGFGGSSFDTGRSIAVDSQGNVYVGGDFDLGINFGAPTSALTCTGFPDAYIAKFDASGTPVWAKNFGDGFEQRITSLRVDHAGNILVSGWFRGGINFGAATSLTVAMGSSSIFVAKLDPQGGYLWQRGVVDSDELRYPSIAVDTADNVVLATHAKNNVSFGGAVLTTTNTNLRDWVVAKYRTDGGYLWARRFTGSNESWGRGISTSGLNVISTGYISGSVDFGGGTLTNGSGATHAGILLQLTP